MDEYRQRESLSFEKVSKKKPKSKYLVWGLNNPLLVGAYIVFVIVCTVLFIGANVGSQSGVIDKSDIGTIASHDYKSPRDFTFKSVDRAATEKIRAERVAAVLPIYQWDTDYHATVLARIRNSFEWMRLNIENERIRLEGMRAPRENASEFAQPTPERQAWADSLMQVLGGNGVFADFVSTRGLSSKEVEAGIRMWSDANRSAFVQSIGYDIREEVYQWLVSEGFSQVLEEGLMQEFDTVLGQMIIATRESIDNLAAFTVCDSAGKKEASDKTKVTSQADAEERLARLLKVRFLLAPDSVVAYFRQFVRSNLEFDETATYRERQNVSDTTAELLILEEYKKGQTIVARGNPIEQKHYDVFAQVQEQGGYENRSGYWVALALVAVILLFMCWRSIVVETDRRQKMRDVFYTATNILVYAVLLRLSVMLSNVLDTVYHWPYSILLIFPFSFVPMLMRVVINRYYAYLFTACAIVLTGLIVDDSMVLTYAIVSSMTGCLLMERPKLSNILFKRGVMMGGVSAVMALGIYLYKGTNMTEFDYFIVFMLGLMSGLLSTGMLMIGLAIAESFFGYVTSNKLLELSNLEHPALKTLFIEAPGTYQHSIMVGSLNEAAAEAIGANAILARVGGYFHDIGKVKNAQYFAENQRGDNPHNRLKPNMSALILKAHVRDGVEIAKKYKLPQDIIDFIMTHHGTSRIEYFYQRAKEQQGRVQEEDYRYPGPRPQTRETGICMVSDMVEAAVRSLPDKSPDKILVLVRKLINHKFADGQFDECDLTLRDLNDIADALLGILNAFYHHRPEYPDQKKEREKQETDKREKAEVEKKSSDFCPDRPDEVIKSPIDSEHAMGDASGFIKMSDSRVMDGVVPEKIDKTEKNGRSEIGDIKSDTKEGKRPKDKKEGKEDKHLASGADSKEQKTPKDKKDVREEKTAKDKSVRPDDKDNKDNYSVVIEKTAKADNVGFEKMDGAGKKGEASISTKKESPGPNLKEGAEGSGADKPNASANGEISKPSAEREDTARGVQPAVALGESVDSGLVEAAEADELLKESGEEAAEEPRDGKAEPSRSVHDTYELMFSSRVDVFKKT